MLTVHYLNDTWCSFVHKGSLYHIKKGDGEVRMYTYIHRQGSWGRVPLVSDPGQAFYEYITINGIVF